MNAQRRIAVDALCAASIFLSLAYFFTGNDLHELAGTLAVVLLLVHNFFNFRWWKKPAAGTLNLRKILTLFLNIALACALIAVTVSGVMLSTALFPFVPSGEGLLARKIHTASAMWLLLLSALHAGLHSRFLAGTLKISTVCAVAKNRCGNAKKFLCGGILALAGSISVFGIFSFMRRAVAQKITAEMTFDPFAFDDTLPRFFADYFSIAILFFCVGFLLEKLLARK